MRQVETSEKVT